MLQDITNCNRIVGGNKPLAERSSNLELYRIIVMLLIVAHHYVVNSGLTGIDGPIHADPLSAKSVYLVLFGMWGKTGINCFVLITGYISCAKAESLSENSQSCCWRSIFTGLFAILFSC